MPLDVTQIDTSKRERKTITVDCPLVGPDASAVVTYVPGNYNAAIEHRLVEDSGRLPATSIDEFITTFVVDWDLTNGIDDDGEPVPLALDDLGILPLQEVKVPIFNAIIEDMNEAAGPKGRAPSNGSRSPSSTATARPRR